MTRPIRYLILAAAFAAAYGQAPLYYSNQNQYFLHGFALADQGLLPEDWLANTLDPTPVFSLLTAWTVRYLHPWVFHLYQAVLMGIYAAAMLDLYFMLSRASSPPASKPRQGRWLLFAFLFVLVHSALLRWISYRLGPPELRHDYAWYFQAGLASQYLLGAMFQPSAFGVLLLAALVFFLRDRPVLTSLCIAAAATIHNTYLLPGAMLTAGFLVQLAMEKRYRNGLLLGALTLALVLPTVVHSLRTFGPTTPELFARSQDILANDRIPHHCVVARWLDPPAMVQIAWVLAALMLVWKTRLFAVLAVCMAVSALLTVVQVVTMSNLLALLFPWRISALLVPLATTIVLSRLVGTGQESGVRSKESGRGQESGGGMRPRVWLAAAGLLVLAAAGLGISFERLAFAVQVEDRPLMYFIRATKETGDVYLLPAKALVRADTKLSGIRSLSGDFKPQDRTADSRLIPLELQQFRLSTEAPIFVDFKSIPYKDVEVIEWYERMILAAEIQQLLKKGDVQQVLAKLLGHGVTHLVQAEGETLSDPRLFLIYPVQAKIDSGYRVYRLVK